MKSTTVILAAGASSRLGQPKQLIQINHQFILEKLYKELCQLTDSTWVVTGCYHDEIKQQFPHMNLIYNENWSTGMGSSIYSALQFLGNDYTHLLICVCDQVLIKSAHYKQLIKTSINNPNKIIATSYKNTLGVPCLFPKKYFLELQLLNSTDQGAKSVLTKNHDQIIALKCEVAKYDIDTPSQLNQLT
jgi:molybdenum cofactor cytidylyltransferase